MVNGQVTEEVEQIVDHRTTANKVEYLVQWTSDQEKTWEDSSHLTECDEALALYWRNFIQKNPHHTYMIPDPLVVQEAAKAAAKAAKQPKPAKAKESVKRQKKAVSRPVSEDKIAVAKRVQMTKMLAGSRSRGIRVAAAAASAAASSSLTAFSVPAVSEQRAEGNGGAVKPPPASAKRCPSDAVAGAAQNQASQAAAAATPGSPPVQRARKSTGRRIPGFSAAELPSFSSPKI
ncbi:hypothetical protein H4R99_002283 [Coemansia sp. RSA 1722]|nr:hypothetical protein LPJ57_006296 [Coemansia sp. RSA 486]KAJ2220324.1 M-phase phosphoprotein 8 [Coemansia sp. RSA 485]KAJ2603702.1 hypothetical protein H4R99_002283 [Coemansia sp. RSA 1722]KAJ2640144.1 hypothetical protein GGF40_000292 [Coemansia sp. RSA 1286]